jgi:hypothetical protein
VTAAARARSSVPVSAWPRVPRWQERVSASRPPASASQPRASASPPQRPSSEPRWSGWRRSSAARARRHRSHRPRPDRLRRRDRACRCGARDAISAGCRGRPVRRSCRRPYPKNSVVGGGAACRPRGKRGQDRKRRVTLATRPTRGVPWEGCVKAAFSPQNKSRNGVFRRIRSGPSGYRVRNGPATALERL